MELLMYAIRNKEGKYFRRKGYSGYGESWVDNINKARIYGKPGPAKAQINYWFKRFPEFGCPDLVVMECKVKEVINMEDAVRKSNDKAKKRNVKMEINSLSSQLSHLHNLISEKKNKLEEMVRSN